MGAFIKPYRTYISNKTIKRINRNFYAFQTHGSDKNIANMINSYLGVFSHYKSNKIKKKIMDRTTKILNYGCFIGYYDKFIIFS